MPSGYLHEIYEYLRLNVARARESPQPIEVVSFHLVAGGRYADFAALLKSGEDEEMRVRLRQAETIGRPIGSNEWLEDIE